MDTTLLKDIGLTEGEIKVYLGLLRLGTSSTGPITKESQVSISKLYIILDKLEKKGLVSHYEENNVKYFKASEPSKITDYINEKEKKIKTLEKNFKNFLPQLDAIYNDDKKEQKVSFFQGLKGLMTAHENVYRKLKKGDEFVYMGIPSIQPSSHHAYWNKDHRRRIKLGITTRLLFNDDTPKETLKNRNSFKGSDARSMPIGMKTPAYFMIYKDVVMVAIPSENSIAIEIISQEVADSFKVYFEEFWKLSKPFKM